MNSLIITYFEQFSTILTQGKIFRRNKRKSNIVWISESQEETLELTTKELVVLIENIPSHLKHLIK
jgi:hypothetical protein